MWQWRLYLSYMTGFLSYMSIGAIISYPSPAFPQMRLGDPPQHLSDSSNSWLASFDGLFAIPGGILVLPLMKHFGRKLTLFYITLPLCLGWLLVVCTFNITTLAVGRAVSGLALGMELGCLFVYIAEISPKQQRGCFGAIPNIFLAVGAILVNLLGDYINWRCNAVVCLMISVAALLLSYFMYETPRWLISQGYSEAATDVINKIWSIDDPARLQQELEDIQNNVKVASTQNAYQSILQLVAAPLWKPLLISQLLIAFQQLTGTAYINSYTVEIFQEATSSSNSNSSSLVAVTNKAFTDPYYQSSFVWFTNAVGTLLSIFIIDRYGRRVLLISTSVIITVSLTAIGAYYYLKPLYLQFVISYLDWLPIAGLVLYNFSFGAGFAGIPYLLLSEMFPLQTREVASGLGIASRNLYFFIVAKVFANLKTVPYYGMYWIYAGVGFLGLIFVIFFVPETKGKSLEEVQQLWYQTKQSDFTVKKHSHLKKQQTSVN